MRLYNQPLQFYCGIDRNARMMSSYVVGGLIPARRDCLVPFGLPEADAVA